jgi:hypothetical protein
MDRQLTLGVITIATNEYVDYWADQARSFSANVSQDVSVTLHVFTDQTAFVKKVASELRIRVIPHKIPSYKWPQATLYRYKTIHEFREELTQDVLMHLDADMLVHHPITARELLDPLERGICLVRHPGYFRPKGLASLFFYFKNPDFFPRDFLLSTLTGSLGTWETRKESLAFVPRGLRNKYYCGGTWWGRRSNILDLTELLAKRVSEDEANGVTAVWHDESHLNWWSSRNRHGSVDPRYCFSLGYVQLQNIPNLIQAVDK